MGKNEEMKYCHLQEQAAIPMIASSSLRSQNFHFMQLEWPTSMWEVEACGC